MRLGGDERNEVSFEMLSSKFQEASLTYQKQLEYQIPLLQQQCTSHQNRLVEIENLKHDPAVPLFRLVLEEKQVHQKIKHIQERLGELENSKDLIDAECKRRTSAEEYIQTQMLLPEWQDNNRRKDELFSQIRKHVFEQFRISHEEIEPLLRSDEHNNNSRKSSSRRSRRRKSKKQNSGLSSSSTNNNSMKVSEQEMLYQKFQQYICSKCNKLLTYVISDAKFACNSCATSTTLLESSLSASNTNSGVLMSAYDSQIVDEYRKFVSNFLEIKRIFEPKIQKTAIVIPPELIDLVKDELRKTRLPRTTYVTYQQISSILLKQKRRIIAKFGHSFAKQKFSITNIMNNHTPCTMNQELTNLLMFLFITFESIHKEMLYNQPNTIPSSDSTMYYSTYNQETTYNLFSTSSLQCKTKLYYLLQMLNATEFCPYLRLLQISPKQYRRLILFAFVLSKLYPDYELKLY